ncbi:hypothetical protein COCVIDRAFT_86329, partial [Bipolaris victoriae FI3]
CYLLESVGCHKGWENLTTITTTRVLFTQQAEKTLLPRLPSACRLARSAASWSSFSLNWLSEILS